MKKYVLSNLFIFACCISLLAGQPIILKKMEKRPPTNPTYKIPTSPSINAELWGEILNVDFEDKIGVIQIAIENETGIKMIDITDSDAASNWAASTENLENGTYTLTIETEEEIFEGEFEIDD